jgi:hypothetical protein
MRKLILIIITMLILSFIPLQTKAQGIHYDIFFDSGWEGGSGVSNPFYSSVIFSMTVYGIDTTEIGFKYRFFDDRLDGFLLANHTRFPLFLETVLSFNFVYNTTKLVENSIEHNFAFYTSLEHPSFEIDIGFLVKSTIFNEGSDYYFDSNMLLGFEYRFYFLKQYIPNLGMKIGFTNFTKFEYGVFFRGITYLNTSYKITDLIELGLIGEIKFPVPFNFTGYIDSGKVSLYILFDL